jgi:superfamily II DNA or RNA helicase
MTLEQLSRSSFTGQVTSRGRRYFEQGRVKFTDRSPDRAVARVRGSSGTYVVELDAEWLSEGALGATCTCPHFDDGAYCKHIWATILAADAQHVFQGQALPRKLVLVDGEDAEDGWDDEPADESDDEGDAESGGDFYQPRRSVSGQLCDAGEHDSDLTSIAVFDLPSGRRSRRSGAGAWRDQLGDALRQAPPPPPVKTSATEAIKVREAAFVLDLGQSLHAGLAIELFYRETKQNGQFGKFKRLHLSRAELAKWEQSPDRALLEELFVAHDEAAAGYYGYSYYRSYGSQLSTPLIVVAPRAYDALLPKLCASGRFRWMLAAGGDLEEQGRVIAWDDGPAWRFRLRVAVEKKRWVIRGELLREGATEPVPLERPALLTRGGVLLDGDLLARHAASADFGWISVLRRDGEIRIPLNSQADFLKQLYSAPSLPAIDWPPEVAPQEVRSAPRGVVQFARPKYYMRRDQLAGQVQFEYEGQRVAAQATAAAVADESGRRVLIRDRQREQELLVQLASAGVKLVDRNYSRPHNAELPAKHLPQVVEHLLASGWTVEAEGNLLRQSGEFRISVTSNVDWFELDGEFDFGGVAATLPALLAAIRKGERYVRLGDGSHGMLPEAWLKQLGVLADLATQDDGKLRFRPTQALLLDALLASQPKVSFDDRFRKIKSKIESFQGVQPQGEPKGFAGELRPYQRDGLGWLGFLREFGFGGCLADDMGLGKTVQVLAVLQAARNRRLPPGQARRPSLVVVPRSLVFNWLEEARRFTPKLRVLDLSQKDRGGLIDQLGEYDLALTTYGTLIKDINKLKDVPLEYAILDESQAIKNAQSQSAKACRLLHAEHRLAMTGTPIENHLGELWSLLEFLNPGLLGRSSSLARLTSAADGEGPKNEGLAALSRAIAPFILRRTKQQVLKDLPDKTEQTIHCELSPAERKHYDELRDYYRATLTQRIESEGLAKSKIHVLEALLRLRQAACHRGLLDARLRLEPSAKLDMLLEQLEELRDEGHKALVFSQFTSLLAIVRDRFDKRGWTYEYLDGQTRNRQEKVDRFQSDPACPLFLVSLKAGGRGLNLTAADYVFILDPWWNPAVEAQAVDRAHRIGQSRHVFAYRLIAKDTVEEKILELQRNKRDLADAIIGADQSLLQDLTGDDLRLLLS